MTEAEQGLVALLADEHAAVYAYGLLGARLGVSERRRALSAYDAHRAVRDDLRAVLARRGLQGPPPAPAYEIAVSGVTQARALAVRVEEGLAVRWRDLVATTDEAVLRRLAVQRLQECAVRAAAWRRAQRVTPTVPFPGRT